MVVGGDISETRKVELFELRDDFAEYTERNFSGCHLAPTPHDNESQLGPICKYHLIKCAKITLRVRKWSMASFFVLSDV